MRYQFENLGLLDQAELDMASLTLICGENNTGKTYATYAIYGFLRSWRQILRVVMEETIDGILKESSQYRIDLVSLFDGKIDSFLKKMGEVYVGGLPRAFATQADIFKDT